MALKLLNIIRYFFHFGHFTSHNDLLRTSFGVFHGSECDVASENYNSDVTFNVACVLSQPMGKTKFSSSAKNRINSVSQVRRIKTTHKAKQSKDQEVSPYPA